jgi:diguanylate cyclase (GGDEF)-like protein
MAPAPSTASADSILDALPDATAVLDDNGTIVSVSYAWRMFAVDNGGRPETTGVGVSYLAVCQRAASAGSADAATVRSQIELVLNGETVHQEFEYPCPSPVIGRWFLMRVNALRPPARGAVVSHVNITRRKQAEDELAHAAAHDPLTALPNPPLFNDRLARALQGREGRPSRADVGILFIDLDRFKFVNDTYGHQAGDEVLLVTASRLREQVRPQDTVARFGGDEFAVLAPRISAEGLNSLAARIATAIAAPHRIHGDTVAVSASVGTYLAAPGESTAHALQCADEAMYDIKRNRL